MNLSKQIYLYSIDTSAFYNEQELELQHELNEISLNKVDSKKQLKKVINEKEKALIQTEIKGCIEKYKLTKMKLKEMLVLNQNIRILNPEFLIKKNIVAMFEGNATRTFGMEQNQLYTDIFIVRVYFFEIIKDIMKNGFFYNNEKYIYFTSSAGQIRTKKTVFIKKSLWESSKNSLMCGLTITDINQRGGININKFLAYLALCNGATEPMKSFDITKTVVVDDFKTLVRGEVDYIDAKTYAIERKIMDVPINHCDGCGMILPRINQKNFMIRLPWIKGLLSPFAFDEFCRMNEHNGDITDIYGKKYNIFTDEIMIIFTKSQFKMYKYYDSWQDYIDKFIENNCEAGMCNEDEDYVPKAKYNYQMLQTLSDMTDDELEIITETARNDILNIASDRKTMLKIFGVSAQNKNKSYLQQALEIYPEMLSDVYCKDILKLIKRKRVTEGRSAKFEVNGKYAFLIPDLYAFCERLFLGQELPGGLLNDGEVYCNLFPNAAELNCLRSPHLFKEHAVRKNITDVRKKQWFTSQGIYTSTYDLISKLLQFDVDGDRSLVCACPTIIKVAKRNMEKIVPLYYEMGSAKPVLIDSLKLYEGLVFAFTYCNIGLISNDIAKIWNGDDIDLDVIKLLCMENNFIIDAAKTLTKLERPGTIKNIIRNYTNKKLPRFFIYAKDKNEEQVEPANNSVVNRLKNFIPNKRIFFKPKLFGSFDYKMLMSYDYISGINLSYNDISLYDIKIDEAVISLYEKVKIDNKYNLNIDDPKHSNKLYLYQDSRDQLLAVCDNIDKLVNMLVIYLYHEKNSKDKEGFWYAFGDVLLNNLKNNLAKKYGKDYILCANCSIRIKREGNRHKYCHECLAEKERIRKRTWWNLNKKA